MRLTTLFILLLASIIHAGVTVSRRELDHDLEARRCIDTTCRRGDDNEACRSACVRRTEHKRVSFDIKHALALPPASLAYKVSQETHTKKLKWFEGYVRRSPLPPRRRV